MELHLKNIFTFLIYDYVAIKIYNLKTPAGCLQIHGISTNLFKKPGIIILNNFI
jgi:hypothetical protein